MIPGVAGSPIAVHETGEGRTLLLLHGLMSNANVNWIKYGHAARLAGAGYRVVMPDFPAHGESAASHDPAAYPADVLAKTVEAVIAELDLADLDLAGFSLGSRTSVRLIERGLKPRRVILAGMGVEALFNWDKRREFFLNAIERFDVAKRGDADYFSIQFMKSTQVDVTAIRLLLESGSPLDPAALKTITMPTLVLCGTEDRDNGDPDALAAALPDATRADVPGGHMSCITKAELSEEMVRFLSA
jgi:pimeloyl-ACP methyl ester carboxylesterase